LSIEFTLNENVDMWRMYMHLFPLNNPSVHCEK